MIPPEVERATRTAALWVRDLTDDWVVVKVEIQSELSNEWRRLFTRRDDRTKLTLPPNPMELEVIELWRDITGVSLVVRSFNERRGLSWWEPDG